MILSVSRRTDIPNYYSDWFFNRIKEGFVYVRNPMNIHQVSKISLSPEVVDCIVFWTKNPADMMDRLDELSKYSYYFQFTLTGYGKDIEVNLPHKKEEMIPCFQRLSKKIGSKKVIWRYDPILFNDKYTTEYHINAFRQIAESLNGYTEKCVISFVDIYSKNKKKMEQLKLKELTREELLAFVRELNEISHKNGMTLATCAERYDFSEIGVEHNCCIDKKLIEEITGLKMNVSKDKTQRTECGCMESVEIGAYNTCKNGCKYCYANYSDESVIKNSSCYDPQSPLLCGEVESEDRINERKVKSLGEGQLSIFD